MEQPQIESSTGRYGVPVVTNEEYNAVDKKLYDAINTLEMSRQMLSSTWSTLAYSREMNNRICESYNELHMKHYELQKKHSDSTGELEEKSVLYSDLLIDWEQNHNRMYAQEARIRQLEQDKNNMSEEHRRALVFAADRISAADRKLAELQSQQSTITLQQPPKKRLRRPRDRKPVKALQEKDDSRVDMDGEAFDRACETERPRDSTAVKSNQNKDDGQTGMEGQTFDRVCETERTRGETG